MRGQDRRLNLDWVSVRYRSVVLLMLLFLGLGGAAWLTWSHYHGRNSPSSLASREIDAAARLFAEAQSYDQDMALVAIRNKAQEYMADARSLYAATKYEEARVKAILSRSNSQKVIDIARSEETTRNEVHFYRIDGDVKVRRAGNLSWEGANLDSPLRAGDTIKTASHSSTQVIYFDGSITTVKPGSMVEITNLVTDPTTRQVRVTESLKVGGVRSAAFGNKARGSLHEVATRNSVARADTAEKADFEVDYDAGRNSTSVSVHQGTAALTSGEKSVTVQSAERVSVAAGGDFGPRESLLPPPHLLAPGDRKIFVHDGSGKHATKVVWAEIPGASAYVLQVSRQALMADLAHERTTRSTTTVQLPALEVGNWYWRVVAVDRHGKQGTFSPVAQFRVAGSDTSLLGLDQPPDLDVTEFLQTGNLVIVSGQTNPNANLWVDNQKVDVYEDGSFTAVVRLHRQGRNVLEIIAQDPAGNETVTRREAFLEVF